ncbi:MAG: hypothetical protein JO202_08005 [Ktedonobacteraceae bacterium]|nr:hypothetical protein [Ktedonobacteraceae bacterium]
MTHQHQQHIEIQDPQQPSKEGKQVASIFADMRSKQLDFLDASGKSMIERIATFLAILFAVTAFSNNFPPAYLKGNLPAKIMVIVTLVLYLLAILPRLYDVLLYNVTRMSEALKAFMNYKMRRLRVAGVLFALGSVALAVLIVVIIWKV